MKNQERYSTVSHLDLIVQDGCITIPSIFMFSDPTELLLYLDYCRNKNCVVYFENEDMRVEPNYNKDTNIKLTVYSGIINQPKFAFDYVKFLRDRNDMTWDKAKEVERK